MPPHPYTPTLPCEPITALCPFLDMETRRCLIYPARLLVCRLFGHAPWLPCPAGRVTQAWDDAIPTVQAYAALERRPIRVWLARAGIALPGQE